MDLVEDLRNATCYKTSLFESVRGKHCTFPYWDAVVLTALDRSQQEAFQLQLKDKLSRNELPLSPAYHVFHDPPGPKVGNGGATMVVMHELEKIYGDKLNNFKVLILHAGGYSQRLPSASMLGKIFTALPIGSPYYQMLELKLAMYVEFPQRMKPGVFVSSADCIELYNLEGDWSFENPGFTALAHPSPIEIGTTHGVFVLANICVAQENSGDAQNVPSTCMRQCRQFLHKPTKELMHSRGAVFSCNSEDYIYSDSAYYMDMPTARSLLHWYRNCPDLSCEIDAYGDFLQALGEDGTSEYCQNTSNVTVVTPDLVQTREQIFNLLHHSQLNVLLLNKSKFYHIGTTQEYIEHFCLDDAFRRELNCHSMVTVRSGCNNNNNNKDDSISTDLDVKNCFPQSNVLIHCLLGSGVSLEANNVIEYADIGSSVTVHSNTILSNVVVPDETDVPTHTFLHTAVVREGANRRVYVTLAFGVDDNLKKCCQSRNDTPSLSYAGVKLHDALDTLHLLEDPWPANCDQFNLWHARLFPAFETPEWSIKYAVEAVSACRQGKKFKCDIKRAVYSRNYSMADILKLKDLEGILEMRNALLEKILRV